jgi:hypothetical protein
MTYKERLRLLTISLNIVEQLQRSGAGGELLNTLKGNLCVLYEDMEHLDRRQAQLGSDIFREVSKENLPEATRF